jgi:hypothetical protein
VSPHHYVVEVLLRAEFVPSRVVLVFTWGFSLGSTIYVGSCQTTAESWFAAWRSSAKRDYLSMPLLRYTHQHWGNPNPCTFEVLTSLELPEDAAAAKTALRLVEDGYIQAVKSRGEPIQNNNAPVCRCADTSYTVALCLVSSAPGFRRRPARVPCHLATRVRQTPGELCRVGLSAPPRTSTMNGWMRACVRARACACGRG